MTVILHERETSEEANPIALAFHMEAHARLQYEAWDPSSSLEEGLLS